MPLDKYWFEKIAKDSEVRQDLRTRTAWSIGLIWRGLSLIIQLLKFKIRDKKLVSVMFVSIYFFCLWLPYYHGCAHISSSASFLALLSSGSMRVCWDNFEFYKKKYENKQNTFEHPKLCSLKRFEIKRTHLLFVLCVLQSFCFYGHFKAFLASFKFQVELFKNRK